MGHVRSKINIFKATILHQPHYGSFSSSSNNNERKHLKMADDLEDDWWEETTEIDDLSKEESKLRLENE